MPVFCSSQPHRLSQVRLSSSSMRSISPAREKGVSKSFTPKATAPTLFRERQTGGGAQPIDRVRFPRLSVLEMGVEIFYTPFSRSGIKG
jgi:hypothetical protein